MSGELEKLMRNIFSTCLALIVGTFGLTHSASAGVAANQQRCPKVAYVDCTSNVPWQIQLEEALKKLVNLNK